MNKVLIATLLAWMQFAIQVESMREIMKRTCIGTNFRTRVPFHEIESRYADCTHIIGNLEIYFVDPTKLRDRNLQFLHTIEEITGNLVIFGGELNQIKFKKLKIIRGETLFRLSPGDPEYAVLIKPDTGLETVEFPSLKAILGGSVGIFPSKRLCYLETINWQGILSGEGSRFIYYVKMGERWLSGDEIKTPCGRCASGCEGGCWGVNPEQCQDTLAFKCRSNCGRSLCFKNDFNEYPCCHPSCAGGCTGPEPNQCLSCGNVRIDGECRDKCDEGKIRLGSECVDACPMGTLRKWRKGEYVCDVQCPVSSDEFDNCRILTDSEKVCQGHSGIWPNIHSGNIEEYRNCTIIEGDILIDDHTFSGTYNFAINFTHSSHQKPLRVGDLEIFSSVQEIFGSLTIRGGHGGSKTLHNLTWLRNLEIITGNLNIKSTALKSLNLRGLRIVSGEVSIEENSDLCYVSSLDWSRISGKNEPSVKNNRQQSICEMERSVCSSRCHDGGCWGPQTEDCFCVDYKPNPFNNGNYCVKSCPPNKCSFNGECVSYRGSCENNCDLRNNHIPGSTQCKMCAFEISPTAYNVEWICNKICQDGSYVRNKSSSAILLPGAKLVPNPDSFPCLKCHPLCARCTGPEAGTKDCLECKYGMNGDNCAREETTKTNLVMSSTSTAHIQIPHLVLVTLVVALSFINIKHGRIWKP